MSRVTVEDCIGNVDNRFNLVLTAAKRAHHLLRSGEEPTIPWGRDKATVVALREVAAGNVNQSILDEE